MVIVLQKTLESSLGLLLYKPKTSLIDSSLDAIVTMCQNGSLDSLYVYSDMTVEALESKEVDWSAVELFYTDSCKPDSTKWKTIKNFYPGEEGEAPL